jgi:predicted RNase H-like HicB family nuclease
MNYRVVVENGEDFGYVSHCPAIPGCHSQGDTIEEAIENIKDAIIGCLEALDKDLIKVSHSNKEYFLEVAI